MKMKYILVSAVLVFFFSCKKTAPQLTFIPAIYDFGELVEDSLYAGSIVVKNTGNKLLEIKEISADCGCTKISLSKYDVQPNDTALLRFAYNTSGKKGEQENYILITSNTDSLVQAAQINAYIK